MFTQAHKIFRVLILWMLIGYQSVAAQVVPSIENWQEVGRAELSVLWFDVYDATFYTPSGSFESFTSPLQLSLDYKRDISKSDLITETDKQFARFNVGKELRAEWLVQLDKIWPDIAKGEQLIFQANQMGKADFFHNQVWIGSVEDPQFSQFFIQIWLSEQGEYPRLAKKLKGQS